MSQRGSGVREVQRSERLKGQRDSGVRDVQKGLGVREVKGSESFSGKSQSGITLV
jgi:hypothetical protein